MNFYDLLKLSTRMFKARTSRTILTVLGMGVGIGAILFLVSLGYGLQRTLLQKITTSDSLLTLDVTESGSGVILDNSEIDRIKNIEGVLDVSPRSNISSRAKIGDLSADLIVASIPPSFLKLGGVQPMLGDTLSDDNDKGVLISNSAAQAFNKSAEEILGQKINFVFNVPVANGNGQSKTTEVKSNVEYSVVGVTEEDENVVYINSSTLGYINISKSDQLKVRCVNNSQMQIVREELIKQGLSVSSLSDAVDQANKVFRVIQIVLGCFGAVALVVSAIGMFNTMTIALLERTKEIGIMKSIGASDAIISSMFIMESTIMGFLGGLGGVIMGYLTGKFFNILVNLLATRLGGSAIELFYTPNWFVIMIIIFGSIVGCATGVIPARRASSLDTLEALHNK